MLYIEAWGSCATQPLFFPPAFTIWSGVGYNVELSRSKIIIAMWCYHVKSLVPYSYVSDEHKVLS